MTMLCDNGIGGQRGCVCDDMAMINDRRAMSILNFPSVGQTPKCRIAAL